MRIRGQGRVTKMLNVYRSRRVRQRFDPVTKNKNGNGKGVALHLYSFSGNSGLYDQILSIRSFLNHVGVPENWTIFSDGTLTDNSCKLLQEFDFVSIRKDAEKWAGLFWMEKKFRCYSSVMIKKTSIFLDSDILFFQGFTPAILASLYKHNWYLSDLSAHFDPVYLADLKNIDSQMNFTNSGFFVLNANPDWSGGARYLEEMSANKMPLGHFSEQTAMEIVFKQNDFRFLDPRLFSLSMDDNFTLGSNIDYSKICIRHFVGPIRFRMWLIAAKNKFFQA